MASTTSVSTSRHFVNAIKALYHLHSVALRLGGRVFEGFAIFAGIKQGCPCSGSLFALALDPFLRYLCMRIPIQLSLRAFADDLGCMLEDLVANLRLLTSAFGLLALAACLKAHPAKTQVAILWNPTRIDVKGLFESIGGDWAKVQINGAIKYLGALLGPDAHRSFWEATTSKYQGAAELLSKLGFATPSALRWYAIAVQSVPAYLCSLQPPSKALIKAEALAITHITNIPHQSIPLYTYSTRQPQHQHLQAQRTTLPLTRCSLSVVRAD